MHAETLRRTPIRPLQLTRSGIELQVNQNRFGSQEIEITDVELRPGNEIKSGDPLEIVIGYRSPGSYAAPSFSVTLIHQGRSELASTPDCCDGATLPVVQGRGKLRCRSIDSIDLTV
jgi:lipopolysaccharide transport system ATP-binding protein